MARHVEIALFRAIGVGGQGEDSDVTVYTLTTCCSDCGKVLNVAP
jgi:hypothetical protein